VQAQRWVGRCRLPNGCPQPRRSWLGCIGLASVAVPRFSEVVEELMQNVIKKMQPGVLPLSRRRGQVSMDALFALGSAGHRWLNNAADFESDRVSAEWFLSEVSAKETTRRDEA
jgi:hypothetical protein